jgi:hypothetical protein
MVSGLKQDIDRYVDAPGLPEKTAQAYREAAHAVAEKMTPEAIDRFNRHVMHTQFYGDSDQLRAGYERQVKQPLREGEELLGFCTHYPGTGKTIVNLDEPDESHANRFHTYAHEFAHATDGPKHELSETDEWRSAWDAEIKQGKIPPSEYATTDQHEGFAEYARMVMTMPAVAKRDFPRCWEFWRRKGIA